MERLMGTNPNSKIHEEEAKKTKKAELKKKRESSKAFADALGMKGKKI